MNKFKKLTAAFILSLSAITAFASPSPKQIEKALAAGDISAARSMVSEVLREHPNSAKAHLFNAYILEHADKNKAAANEELKQVIRLDKTGDVQGSALFGKVVAEIEAPTVAPRKYVDRQLVAQPVSNSSVNYAQKSSTPTDYTLLYILLGFGAITGIVYLYVATRPEKPAVIREWSHPVNYETGSRATYHRPVSRNTETVSQAYVQPVNEPVHPVQHVQHHYSQPYQAPQQPQQQGLGAMGTAASVAGGVVAGNLLSDALRHGVGHSHSSHGSSSWESTPRSTYREPEPVYEAPAKVDYEVREASFSSGRSSSWDDTPSYSSSSSSSSDSWSSSSSSSSDYSSSSDSGSSGSWD